MDWLSNWITREGKGIPKDAPKKTGFALFFSTIGREAWELFKLNLMLLLLAIPVVTIPASFAAACRICSNMLEDEVVFLWRDFWRAFSDLFLRATHMGWLFAAVATICGYAVYIYVQMARQSLVYVALIAIAFFVTLIILMIMVCFFVLMARKGKELGIRQTLRLAALAAMARPFDLLAGIAFTASLWLAHIIFYPASIFLPIVLNFSLGALAMTFSAFKATDFALASIMADKVETQSKAGAKNPALERMHISSEEHT